MMALWLALLAAGGLSLPGRAAGNRTAAPEHKDVPGLLAAVVSEVRDLGRHPGEDFTRWEFFLGEDDDDTNKDIHAVVVIHEDPLRLRIHITDLDRLPSNPRVRVARRTRVIFARGDGERLTLEKSDYPPRELVPVLRSLLKAIRDKKKLLRETAVPPPFLKGYPRVYAHLLHPQFGQTGHFSSGRSAPQIRQRTV
jgi:hypothetical protein